MALRQKKSQSQAQSTYDRILMIDGSHPFKEKVPFGYVEYQVRKRKNGKITFFNFPLAKEMGLISNNHQEKLNKELSKSLLEAFANVIINEFDLQHEIKYPLKDIKPQRYMATRYLQLQHPNKKGITSGDGRSIWNGIVKNNGKIWDISSRGTGATCLSPATAINNKFYQTGDPNVSYGCGYSIVSEGIIDVLFSEVFLRNGISTERVLCVIEFPGNYSITVRANPNLLRPSHFFGHLKQGKYQRLKSVADYFIDREISNGAWAPVPKGMNKYDYMLEKLTETFATIVAQFEEEYLFVWLDWDGDNILANGGIIDFGSVRQFGLFHHEYRFDDDARWSTNIKEQKLKARHIIQTFAQIVNYLKTGRRKPLSLFKAHKSIRQFKKIFDEKKKSFFLRRVGFDTKQIALLMEKNPKSLRDFEAAFRIFEATKSKRGPVKVPDGITWNAVYCMRDILRELPAKLMTDFTPVTDQEFIKLGRSTYARNSDLKITSHLHRKISQFQKSYMGIIQFLSKEHGQNSLHILKNLSYRSALINRYERITGDAVCHVVDQFLENKESYNTDEFHKLLNDFIERQNLNPDLAKKLRIVNSNAKSEDPLIKDVMQIVRSYREGL